MNSSSTNSTAGATSSHVLSTATRGLVGIATSARRVAIALFRSLAQDVACGGKDQHPLWCDPQGHTVADRHALLAAGVDDEPVGSAPFQQEFTAAVIDAGDLDRDRIRCFGRRHVFGPEH